MRHHPRPGRPADGRRRYRRGTDHPDRLHTGGRSDELRGEFPLL